MRRNSALFASETKDGYRWYLSRWYCSSPGLAGDADMGPGPVVIQLRKLDGSLKRSMEQLMDEVI